MKTALLFCVLCAFSCFPPQSKRIITVKNSSQVSFDSIILHINDYKFNLGTIDTGQTRQLAFRDDSLVAKHDVVYYFQAYRNNTVKVEGYKFLGDLGYIPARVDVTITDTLSLIYRVDW